MRSVLVVVLTLAALPPALADEKAKPVTFAKEDAGKLPKDWERAQTGEGDGSVWKVVADDSAPSKTGFALAQLAEGPTRLFNLAVVKESSFRDGSLSVQYKAVAGKIDQGGGVVWRYQDAKNYYISRYNPLEENFRVYKVVDGKRIQLATKEAFLVPAGEWHTLSISQKGKRIQCSLDGKVYLDVEDDAIGKPGKVGLWTKADAQTHFDDFVVTPTADAK